MSIGRWAIVNEEAPSLVYNVVVWDGVTPWDPGEGMQAINVDGIWVGPGFWWTGGLNFVYPPPEE